MFEKLESIFIEIGLDYVRQGSYAEDDVIPESYFAYWNNGSPLESYYDNKDHRAIWLWSIYFYTKDPSLLYSKMDEFIELAKREGFVVENRGYDIPSDLPNYVGRMTQIKYIEKTI